MPIDDRRDAGDGVGQEPDGLARAGLRPTRGVEPDEQPDRGRQQHAEPDRDERADDGVRDPAARHADRRRQC